MFGTQWSGIIVWLFVSIICSVVWLVTALIRPVVLTNQKSLVSVETNEPCGHQTIIQSQSVSVRLYYREARSAALRSSAGSCVSTFMHVFCFCASRSQILPRSCTGCLFFHHWDAKNDPAKNSEGQSPHLSPSGHLIDEAEGLMVEDACEYCGLQVIFLEFLELCRAIVFAEAICFVVPLSDVV